MTDALCAWGLRHGASIHNSIELRDNGVFAKTPISAGEALIYVPWTMCIVSVGSASVSASANASLCVFLLEEREKGSKSDWFQYIAILPKAYGTAMSFSEHDKAYLLGTNLYQEIDRRKAIWEEEAKECGWRLEDYAWASQVVSSRSFPSSLRHTPVSSPLLIPFADAFNHRPLAKIEWLCSDSGFSMKSVEPLSTGSEIHNNYGPKRYGFCLQDNPFDYVTLAIINHTFRVQLNVLSEELVSFFKAACANEYEKNHSIDGPRLSLAALVTIRKALTYKLATLQKPDRPPSTSLQHNARIYQNMQRNILSSVVDVTSSRITQLLNSRCITIDLLNEPSLQAKVQERFANQSIDSLILQGYGDQLLILLLVLILQRTPGHAALQKLKMRYILHKADPEEEVNAQALSEQMGISIQDVLWAMRVVAQEAIEIDQTLVVLE